MSANEPAFPKPLRSQFYSEGLTKREYFAGLAMQALVAKDMPMPNEPTKFSVRCEIRRAQLAVLHADTLIAELAKEKP